MESKNAVLQISAEQLQSLISGAVAQALAAQQPAQTINLDAEVKAPVEAEEEKKPAKKIDGVLLNDQGTTAYRTADGLRYLAQVRVKVNGKMESERLGGFKTRKEAIDWKNKKLATGVSATQVPKKLTVGQMCLDYIEQNETREHPLNYSRVRAYTRLAAHPAIKDVLVKDIGADALRDYCEARKAAGTHASTVMSEFAFINVAITRMAVWLKWPAFNPLRGVRELLKREKLIADPTQRKHRPSAENMDTLRAYFREQATLERRADYIQLPMVDLIDFASINAFRLGEIVELKHSEIDLKFSLIGCDRKYSAATDGTGKREAPTPLLRAAREIIERQPRTDGEDRIFPFDPALISKRFAEACVATKINTDDTPDSKRLRFHDLRHEAISTAAQHIKSHVKLMQFSGHKTLRNLLNYVHDSKEEMSDTASQLDAVAPRTEL